MKNEENEDTEFRSQRTYPELKCYNPNCEFDPTFVPHDRRQIYCCTQCRINHYNDIRGEKARTTYVNEKLLRETDKIIAAMDEKVQRSNLLVNDALLVYEGVNVALSTYQDTNKDTGGQIRWFYIYGLEYIAENEHYIIHKKITKNEKS